MYESVILNEQIASKEKRPRLSFRCINDAPRPGGISPIIFVFGVPPKLPIPQSRDSSLTACFKTIRECTKWAKQPKSQRVVEEASRRLYVPNIVQFRE